MKRLSVILGILLLLSLLFNFIQCKRNTATQTNFSDAITAAQDSLHTYRDELNRQVGQTQVIQTSKADLEKLAELQGVNISTLQKLVKDKNRKLREALVMTSQTQFDSTIRTAIIETDTVTELITVYKDRWLELETRTDLDHTDSTEINLLVHHEFSVWKEEAKGKGLFGKKSLQVFVRNENPYSEVKELKSWELAIPPPRRLGLGLSAAYGIGSDFKLRPFLGVGVHYRIF